MANERYVIRMDSAANCIGDIETALLDYYGAYADPSNLTGVDVLYNTSPYLIFTCTAIADSPIRIQIGSSMRIGMWYGSGYTLGNNVDDPVGFGGTITYGTATALTLVLGPNTLLAVQMISTLNCKVMVVGELSNGDYAVLGMVGLGTNTVYTADSTGYNTTDSTQIWPVSLHHGFQSAAGKLYTQSLILSHGTIGVELNGDGSIASFQDLLNASYEGIASAAVWGGDYVLTPSALYMAGQVYVLPTALLMEYEAEV